MEVEQSSWLDSLGYYFGCVVWAVLGLVCWIPLIFFSVFITAFTHVVAAFININLGVPRRFAREAQTFYGNGFRRMKAIQDAPTDEKLHFTSLTGEQIGKWAIYLFVIALCVILFWSAVIGLLSTMFSGRLFSA